MKNKSSAKNTPRIDRTSRQILSDSQKSIVGPGECSPSPHKPRDRRLNINEVSELTRHKKSWIYEKIKAKRFPRGHKIGPKRFWYESEVDEAMLLLVVPA